MKQTKICKSALSLFMAVMLVFQAVTPVVTAEAAAYRTDGVYVTHCTSDTTYTITKTGMYLIYAYGNGGDGFGGVGSCTANSRCTFGGPGGRGGVSVHQVRLNDGDTITVSVNDTLTAVSGNGWSLVAYAGKDANQTNLNLIDGNGDTWENAVILSGKSGLSSGGNVYNDSQAYIAQEEGGTVFTGHICSAISKYSEYPTAKSPVGSYVEKVYKNNINMGKGGGGAKSGRNTSKWEHSGHPSETGFAGGMVLELLPDTTAPVVSSVSVPTLWGQNSTVTVNATDDSGWVEYAVTSNVTAPASGWSTSSSFTLSYNGNYYAWARDTAGNTSTGKGFHVNKIDTVVPTITAATVTPAGWTGGSTKTISVTATDGHSGIASYAITASAAAPTGGWQTGNTFAKTDGTYYVWAKDNAGHVSSSRQVTVSQIDTNKPTISAVTVPPIWGQDNTVTLTASDIGSGIKDYAVTMSNTVPTIGWQSGNNFTLSANGSYYAWTRDNVGNTSTGKSFTVNKIDTIAPTITDATVTPAGWTGGSTKTISVTATDGQSGIASYAITTSMTAPTGGWQTGNTFAKTDGTYYVWAKDNTGHISTGRQITVSQIDTSKPTVSSVTVPSEWGQDNTITVTAADVGSGIKDYAVTMSNTAPSTGWQNSSDFTLTSNSTYYAWVRDKVDNVSNSYNFVVSKVDTEIPIISAVEVTPAGWTGSNTKTITVTATDAQSGIASYAITANTTAPTVGWQTGNTFAKTDGTYYVWAKDNAGRVSANKQVTVSQIDTSKPTISSVTVPSEWGQDNTVTVTAADVGSGIKDYAVTMANTEPSTGWQSSNSFTLSVNGTYYAWAKDTVENVSDSLGFVVNKVDTEIPIISAATVTPEGWTGSSTKTITVTATDGQSGIAEYAITDNEVEPTDGWQSMNSFDKTEGNYYLWAKDNAGNISLPFGVTIEMVDNVKPTIHKVTVSDQWSVSANIGIGASDLESGLQSYTVTVSNEEPVEGWQSSETVIITSNGDYCAWVKDNANNISIPYPFSVSKVDKLKPVIESITVREKRTLVQRRVSSTVPGVTSIEDIPDKWVKTAELILSATDGAATSEDACSGVVSYALGVSPIEPVDGWQVSSSFTCEQNGLYYLWSKDGAGNVSEPKQYYLNKIDDVPPEFGEGGGDDGGGGEGGGSGSVGIPTRWAQVATIVVKGADNTGTQDFAVTKSRELPTSWQSDHHFDIEANGTYSAWLRDKSNNITGPDVFVIDKVDNLPPGVSNVICENGIVTMEAQDAPASTDSGSSGIIGYAVTKVTAEQPETPEVASRTSKPMPKVADFDWQPDNNIVLRDGGLYEARTIDRAGNISPPCLFEYASSDSSTEGEDDEWDKVVDDILSDSSSEERVYSITMDGNVRIPRSLLVRLRGKAVILRIEHKERYIWAIDCRTIGDIPPWRVYYDLTIVEDGKDSRYLYQLPYNAPIIKRFDVTHKDKEDLPFSADLSIRLHYSFADRYILYRFKDAELIGGELSADKLPPYLKRKSE